MAQEVDNNSKEAIVNIFYMFKRRVSYEHVEDRYKYIKYSNQNSKYEYIRPHIKYILCGINNILYVAEQKKTN